MKVVVVGGGVIGLASAYHLLQAGLAVEVLDASALGSGASHGNAGWVVPAESGPVPAPGMVVQGLKWMAKRDSPLYVKPSVNPAFVRFMTSMARHCTRDSFRSGLQASLALGEHTMDLFDDYARDGMEFEQHTVGLIEAYADPDKLRHSRDNLDLLAAAGLDPQLLTGAQIAESEPTLLPSLAGGILFPHERHLRPDTLVAALVKRCAELGATLRPNVAVTGLSLTDRRIDAVQTPDGPVAADAFLLAAGADSARLARLAGVRLPVWPGKGYSVDYSPAPIEPRHMVSLAEAKVAVTPLIGRLRLAGTMEFAGWDLDVNEARVAAIRRAPRRYFTHWSDSAPSETAWAGARPMTPDGLPIIGALPRTSNGYVATGHGMLGVTLGPATGALIAEAIAGQFQPPQLAPFTAERFGRARARRTS